MNLRRRTSADTQIRTDQGAADVARIKAVVDSESRPYTDPAADYPRAQDYRRQQAAGIARRG